jgi:hypothetical protein
MGNVIIGEDQHQLFRLEMPYLCDLCGSGFRNEGPGACWCDDCHRRYELKEGVWTLTVTGAMKEVVDGFKCKNCGKTGVDVTTAGYEWVLHYRVAGVFNWERSIYEVCLCATCKKKYWVTCESCGDIIHGNNYGRLYLPLDYKGPKVCPGCTDKKE